MASGRSAPTSNLLLASLPADQYRRLLPELEPVDIAAGEAVHKPGVLPPFVFFPCSGIVSLDYRMQDGSSVALSLVGNEGLVGVSLFMDGSIPSSHGVVQCAGQGYRLGGAALRRELAHAGKLQIIALRYIQALITQMAQTAVCNRHHNLDQQICRWLLLSLDRLPGNEVNMTQEQIAQMLGVRREGVTAAAGKLQDAGVLTYSRGRIQVLHRAGLEGRVCECYAVVTSEYDRLLPQPRPHHPHLQAVHDG